MARKPKALAFDSWAMMAYLGDEPAAEKIADLIADGHDDGIPLLITVINAGEIWSTIARETSPPEADRALHELKQLGLEFIEADWALTREAASYKAKHQMSYADCFAAALAKQRKASLVTGDKEFQQIEQEVQITWVI